MRVISLVPSWTETLSWAGVNVVGRTRFCRHPAELSHTVPAVGGTKAVNWEEVMALQPDLLVLDKDENTKDIASQAPVPCAVTHVKSVADVAVELETLGRLLENASLRCLAHRWLKVANYCPPVVTSEVFPGTLKWIRRPVKRCKNLLYLIWRSPWMTVSRDTFIGSVIEKVGYGDFLFPFDERYPQIELRAFDRYETLLLFATEPYPFGKNQSVARETGFPAALVDGEKFSWFGIRSLSFLEECLGIGE